MLKLGEKQTIQTPDGRDWTLGRLELRVVRAWKEYVSGQVGDPFEVVERFVGKISDEHLLPLLREAQVLITETGFENLTRYPFDPRLIG